MKESEQSAAAYIQELEDKIVDLSLQLRANDNALKSMQTEHYERIRKLVHNLKNPIGVVYSFSEMIIENKENSLSEKEKKYCNVIKDSAAFSIDTLNSLAKINSLNSPKFELKIERVNYTNLLTSSLEKFASKAEEKQISIVKMFPGKPILVALDFVVIQQVIENLIKNALRFSPENTTITVSVQENENNIETIITDEGIGIAENDLKTIFKEFSVVNTYSGDNKKCIGFGLAIAKKNIELHNGAITMQSTIDKGSKVSFSFPR